MDTVSLTILRGKIDGLERLFATGALPASLVRHEAKQLLTTDTPEAEKARLQVLMQAGQGDGAATRPS